MSTEAVIAIVVIAALVLLAGGVWAWSQNKRSSRLQQRFGPEYDRTVRESGRSRGERDLAQREQRVQKLRLKELAPEQRERYGQEWRNVQARFVDDPKNAIIDADSLVQRVMDARGYPLTGYDRQAEDVSVDHPAVVSNYRAAHDIAERSRQGDVSTEELRQGMIHYRALFSDLLGVPASA